MKIAILLLLLFMCPVVIAEENNTNVSSLEPENIIIDADFNKPSFVTKVFTTLLPFTIILIIMIVIFFSLLVIHLRNRKISKEMNMVRIVNLEKEYKDIIQVINQNEN